MGVMLTDPEEPNWAITDSLDWLYGERPALRLVEPPTAKPKVYLRERDREVAPRAITQTLIVCGNCGGDEPLPRKTFLTADGRCDACGGRSYVLAARLFLFKEFTIATCNLMTF